MAKKRAVDQVVTAEEAAQIIGVSVRRVRAYLTNGQLPGRKCSVGGVTWLIDRAAAETFQRAKPGRPPREQ